MKVKEPFTPVAGNIKVSFKRTHNHKQIHLKEIKKGECISTYVLAWAYSVVLEQTR